MKLDKNFNQQDFTDWIEEFLPDFLIDIRKVDVPGGFTGVKSINTIGESRLNVRVYIIETDADPSKRRVGLATDSFNLLKNYASPNAIIAYYSEDAPLWRISLLTSTPIWSEGKIITKLSNPKRQSYVLGSKAKIKTPYQFLLSKGKVIDFSDLKSRFSLEVVNKEFYKEISQAFTKLVGGTVANGKSKNSFEPLLKLPSLQDGSQTNLEFAVRLIGRIIFCWFLREKLSETGHSLIPKELVSFDAVNTTQDYYHKILEPIFFEILNKPIRSRKETFINDLFSAIPYLNGGLFSPHEDDFFNYNDDKQAANHNIVVVPDEWLKSFFEVLETYNFTIDENTSFDEDLSIDPEMLGRIFENLLAEINPETGESARKSTGSYYTPRIIVDYMIDESLYLYLKEKTSIEEDKLRSLISYDLEDDISNPLNDEEKDKITQALGLIKILDPACGSGAFPIGALQKIVFILQQIDQNGQLWFKKQIQNTPVELRRVMEREFKEKNFDYIRKLGIIRENIYGIDIQPIATEISRLRCFLTLVVDQSVKDDEENRGVEPLPNLDFKFVTANSLISLPKMREDQMELFDDRNKIEHLKALRDQYFTARNEERKDIMIAFSELQSEMINELIDEHSFTGVSKAELTRRLTDWKPFKHKSTDWFDPEWMFGIKDGFDVVIANPPYVSTKGINDQTKNALAKQFGFSDDLYSHFCFKGIELCKELGVLTYITSKTFWTIQTKKNLRELILRNNFVAIYDTDNPFESVMVDTSVILMQKNNIQREKVLFLNSDGNYSSPKVLKVDKSIYENAVNKVIFRPSPVNLAIYSKYNNQVRTLMDYWWPMISTSKNISKYNNQLEEYRKNLKSGDVTLLGLITDGGVGLQTGNNGGFIGAKEKTKQAQKIIESRPEKLWEVVNKKKTELEFKNEDEVKAFMAQKTEKEIRKLFDSLKDKFGIDLFGKGYIYRIISDEEIADVSKLTKQEMENGINKHKPNFVPYDKGDRDGNRWYLITPFFIEWTEERVNFLKKNSGKVGEGMTVFRNPQFYFKEGFSWNLINGTRTTNDLKFTITASAVNDMASNKLASLINNVSNKYITAVCNSRLINTYTENFINFTVNFPHNSTRQIPIIIPTSKQVLEFENIFDRAFAIKVKQFDGKITENIAEQKLNEIQYELDNKVAKLYGIITEEIEVRERCKYVS